LIDLDGPGTISRGEHLLVRIPGRYVVSHAVAADMGHQTVPLEIKSGRPNLPTSFELKPNYPNPFNPITVIEFGLPMATPAKLIVYNILGQVVTKLVDGDLPAGWHSVDWDAGSVASGVYFYRLEAGSFTQSRKMILIK
jgi:hypothetical protein